MSSLYQLRVTCSKEQDEKIFAWIRKNADLYLIVDEMGNCRHLQGLMDTTKTIRALRESFRRELPELCGNKAYSLTAWEPEAEHLHPAQYFLKGSNGKEPIILLNTMIPEENLPSIIEASKTHAAKLQKEGKKNILTELKEWAKPFEILEDTEIYKKAVEIILRKNQTVRHLLILAWVDTIQAIKGLIRDFEPVKRRRL